MNIIQKIRVKRKIHRMCRLMKQCMAEKDIVDSASTIKYALSKLKPDKKEKLIDVCIEVLKNEC